MLYRLIGDNTASHLGFRIVRAGSSPSPTNVSRCGPLPGGRGGGVWWERVDLDSEALTCELRVTVFGAGLI